MFLPYRRCPARPCREASIIPKPPLLRLEGVIAASGGSGPGLYLVRECVATHRGQLDAQRAGVRPHRGYNLSPGSRATLRTRRPPRSSIRDPGPATLWPLWQGPSAGTMPSQSMALPEAWASTGAVTVDLYGRQRIINAISRTRL